VDRETLSSLWAEAWESGFWYAPWSKALEDLTPEQATWKQYSERHSIWQIVNHVNFWREHTVRSAQGDAPSDEEAGRRTWEDPASTGKAAWERARRQFQETHQLVLAAIRNPKNDLETLKVHLPHDSYHVGQIMFIRALLGLKPLA
jgi:DinB superfamily